MEGRILLRNPMVGELAAALASLAACRDMQDTRIVCRDGTLHTSRLVVHLALPSLLTPLDVGEQEEVVIMPDYTAASIQATIDAFLLSTSTRMVTSSSSSRMVKEEKHSIRENGLSRIDSSDSNGNCNFKVEAKLDVKEEDFDDYQDEMEEENYPELPTKPKAVKKHKTYNCNDCGLLFTRTNRLYQHYQKVHPNGSNAPLMRNKTEPVTDPAEVSCEVCGKHCVTRARLKEHMKKHSDEKNFICMECGKRFKGEDGLKAHMKLHRGEYDYVCDQCDAKYVTASALVNHKNAKHRTEMLYTCEHCGQNYNNRASYSVHLTKHTGEKPYQCRQGCDKRFRKHGARENHERQHKGLKEFHCHLCPKEFMQKRQLAVHIKRHLGQKDHVCQVCGKAYVEAAGARHCKHAQRTDVPS